MTKKASNLIQKLCVRFQLSYDLYEIEVIDIVKAKNQLYDEKVRFHNMISEMFHYDLLSEKDYTALYNTCNNTYEDYIKYINEATIEKIYS